MILKAALKFVEILVLRAKKNSLKICLLFWIAVIFGCNKEVPVPQLNDKNTFHLVVEPSLEQKLYESKSEKYSILNKHTQLYYGKTPLNLEKLNIRGQGALDVRRKSFSVEIDGKITFPALPASKKISAFKLSSMPFDFTYIEGLISHKILGINNLWNLQTFYSELFINNTHQGLYLFIEDPEQYAFNELQAECIIRRYYNHKISSIEKNSVTNPVNTDFYLNLFNKVYDVIQHNSGENLYLELTEILNLENYMRKMAVDFILANGDYTDEIYFCAVRKKTNQAFFEIIPWDYDDIFSGTPHEVGRDWAVGTVFGKRVYNTHNDVLNELNNRLVFSVEDDLDFIIVTDNYLYNKYLEQLKQVLNTLNEVFIENLFMLVKEELEPFYKIPEVVVQSQYDSDVTSPEIFNTNLKDKKDWLLSRVNWITNELEKQ